MRMGEAEKVTLPAAFVLGLMIGRRVKARVEYVEPKITFIPRPPQAARPRASGLGNSLINSETSSQRWAFPPLKLPQA